MSEEDLYLEFKCKKGLAERNLAQKQEYQERLEYELSIIKELGFSSYFLVVQDIITWASSQGILVNFGRGSGAGSLCCYCLKITQVDPIQYDLFFSRFLNAGRKNSFPDIDLDFQDDRREEVVQYIREKYGADRVVNIGTYGTLKTKGAIRDVTRVLGLPYELGDRLAGFAPQSVIGNLISLKDAYESVSELKRLREKNGSDEQKILKLAEDLDGKHRSFGTHASGVVISPVSLPQVVPLAVGKEGEWVTQIDMHDIETLGYIKYDILGLTALTVVSKCLQLIADKTINIYHLPQDDKLTFENLRCGDTVGIFQLETSSGMKDLLAQLQPEKIEDIATLISLFRPGPIEAGLLQRFLDMRSGKKQSTFLHEALEPILEDTCGVCIYQEQTIRIARDLAGFSEVEADKLRAILGKKKVEELPKYEESFKEGVKNNGISKKVANKIWEELASQAKYQFNKSHGVAYAFLTYTTAYLKAHYPTQFLCAALECNKNNPEQTEVYLAECKRLGIKVLGPDINESNRGFTIIPGNGIRFGLSAIKNLGEQPVRHILEVKGKYNYTGLLDFCERIDLNTINKRKLESLVLSGAFDFTGKTRASLLQGINTVLNYKEEQKRYLSKLETFKKRQERFNLREQEKIQQPKKASLKTPEKPTEPIKPYIPDIPELSNHERLAAEKDLIGLYLSGHPLDGIEHPEQTTTIKEILSKQHGYKAEFLGVLSALRESTTKKGRQQMATCAFEDQEARIEATIFPKVYKRIKNTIKHAIPLLVSATIETTGDNEAKNVKCIVEDIRTVETTSQPLLLELQLVQKTLDIMKALLENTDKTFPTKVKLHIRFVSSDGTIFHGGEILEMPIQYDEILDRSKKCLKL